MPYYIFRSKSVPRSLKKVECSMNDLDKIIEDNKENWDLVPSAPAIVAGVYSPRNKPEDGFRDKLREIKKALPPRYKQNVNTF